MLLCFFSYAHLYGWLHQEEMSITHLLFSIQESMEAHLWVSVKVVDRGEEKSWGGRDPTQRLVTLFDKVSLAFCTNRTQKKKTNLSAASPHENSSLWRSSSHWINEAWPHRCRLQSKLSENAKKKSNRAEKSDKKFKQKRFSEGPP